MAGRVMNSTINLFICWRDCLSETAERNLALLPQVAVGWCATQDTSTSRNNKQVATASLQSATHNRKYSAFTAPNVHVKDPPSTKRQ